MTTCTPRAPEAQRLHITLPVRLLGIRRSRFKEYLETRQEVERILEQKKLEGFFTHMEDLVAPPASTLLKQGTLTQQVGKYIIHFNANAESISTVGKLIGLAHILRNLFAVKKYLDDLQQGNLLLEQRESEKTDLPPATERTAAVEKPSAQ